MVGGGPGAMIGEAHRLAARATGFELVAGAFSSDPGKSRAQAEASGLAPERGYADWGQLLTDAATLELQAAIVATPNHLHADQVVAALGAGLHVMCDKPLCISAAEAARISEAARRANRLVAVTYTYEGYPALRRAAEMVAAGEIGALRLAQAEFIQDWLIQPFETMGVGMAAWRMDPARGGPAGATADLGVHAIHALNLVTGRRPTSLSADLTAMTTGRALDDTGLIRLRYADGARGLVTVSQAVASSGGGFSLRALGDLGGVEWRMETPDDLIVLRPGKPRETTQVPPAALIDGLSGPHAGFLNAFAGVYAGFAGAIRGTPARYPLLDDGVAGVAFIEAAVASSQRDGAWTLI